MAIRGTLRSSSVADVLQLLALGRKSGRLVVSAPGRLGLIELEAGMLVHAALPARPGRLGELLVRTGALSPLDAPDQAETDDAALALRLLDEHPSVAAAVRDHFQALVEDAVCEIFLWSEGEFEFEPVVGVSGRIDGIAVPVDHLLLEAARRADERAEIERVVPAGTIPVAVPAQDRVAGAAVTTRQQRILSAIDGQRGIEEIARAAGLLDFDALRGLAELQAAGHIRFEQAEKRREEDVRLRRRLARALDRLGRHDAARREWSGVLTADPSDRDARFRRAVAALRCGDHRAAARDLMRHIEVTGPTAPALQNLALALEAAGRVRDALPTAEEGARRFPADGRLALSVAILRAKAGDLAGAREALDHFDGLPAAGAVKPAAYFTYGVIAHAGCGDLVRAAGLARAGLRSHPDCVDLLVHAGLVAERSGGQTEAESHYRRALELDPDKLQARRALGDVQWARGELAAAAHCYDRLPARERGAEVEYRIGAAFHAVGDHAEAEARWRAALAADAGHLAARRGLGMLRGAAAGEGGR